MGLCFGRTSVEVLSVEEGRPIRLAAILVGLLTALAAAPALALDSSRTLDQLGHTAWTLENGAPSSISAITQTPDGYLWIGAQRGLFRFDGVAFEQIPAFNRTPRRSDAVTALLTTRNGELWVGHYWGGLSVFRNSRLEDINPAPPNGEVRRIVQTRDGAVWAATNGAHLAGLRRYFDGHWQIINAGERGLPREHLADVLATRDGSLWVALNSQVVRLKPGAQVFEPVGERLERKVTLGEDAHGRVWMADGQGMSPLPNVTTHAKQSLRNDSYTFIPALLKIDTRPLTRAQ